MGRFGTKIIARSTAMLASTRAFVNQAVQSVAQRTVHRSVFRIPSLDKLSKAGQVMDRGGLTKAGRALDKHGNRPESLFPKATGSSPAKNAQGQFQQRFPLEIFRTDRLDSFQKIFFVKS